MEDLYGNNNPKSRKKRMESEQELMQYLVLMFSFLAVFGIFIRSRELAYFCAILLGAIAVIAVHHWNMYQGKSTLYLKRLKKAKRLHLYYLAVRYGTKEDKDLVHLRQLSNKAFAEELKKVYWQIDVDELYELGLSVKYSFIEKHPIDYVPGRTAIGEDIEDVIIADRAIPIKEKVTPKEVEEVNSRINFEVQTPTPGENF